MKINEHISKYANVIEEITKLKCSFGLNNNKIQLIKISEMLLKYFLENYSFKYCISKEKNYKINDLSFDNKKNKNNKIN